MQAAAFFRHPPASVALNALVGLLPQVQHQAGWARRFGEVTEKEFIQFISTVTTLSQRLHTTSNGLQKLDCTLHSMDENQALAFSYQLFKKSNDFVHSSLELGDTTLERLQSLKCSLAKCESQRGELRQKVLLFGLIESGFRTELAHLQTRGKDQAEDLHVTLHHLKELHERLAKSTHNAFEDLKQIGDTLSLHLAEYENHSSQLKDRLDSSTVEIRTELARVNAILEQAGIITARASVETSEAVEKVKNIAVAIQFQDIVRQKLEHVAAGFHDIVLQIMPDDKPEKELRADIGTRLATVHNIARIQLVQIEASRKNIEQAISSIVSGLEVMVASQSHLLQNARELNGIAQGALNSSRTSELFQKEIRGLNTASAASAQLQCKVGQMLAALDEFINRFAHDISNSGYDVKLAVINTQIGSALIQQGGPLEMLACETDRNASAFTSVTGILTSEIQAELPHLRDLQEKTKLFLKMGEREQSDLEDEVAEAARRLKQMIESIAEQSASAEGDVTKLQDQIKEMAHNLFFFNEVRHQFDEAITQCEQIIAITSPFSGSGGEKAAQNLDQLKTNYTMKEERLIHENASQDVKMSPPALHSEVSGNLSSKRESDGMAKAASVAVTPLASPLKENEEDIILFDLNDSLPPAGQESGNKQTGSDALSVTLTRQAPEAPPEEKNAKDKITPSANTAPEFGDGIELF